MIERGELFVSPSGRDYYISKTSFGRHDGVWMGYFWSPTRELSYKPAPRWLTEAVRKRLNCRIDNEQSNKWHVSNVVTTIWR